jgi:hypothetical protein
MQGFSTYIKRSMITVLAYLFFPIQLLLHSPGRLVDILALVRAGHSKTSALDPFQ